MQAEIETRARNIEHRPYNIFFKLFYEDFLWQLHNFLQKLCNNKKQISLG